MGTVISWRNAAEAAGVSLSATTEAPGLGVQSLLSPTVAEVWRSATSGATPHRIELDLGMAVPLRLFGAAAPRDGVLLGPAATWRVRVSNTAMGQFEAYSSGVVPLNMRRGVAAILAPATVTARYVQFVIYASAADRYLQLGRIWAGDALVTRRGPGYGWQRGAVDAGLNETAPLSGVSGTQRGAVARTLQFDLSVLPPDDAETLDDIALALGTTGQAFLSPMENMALAMFGKFTEPPSPIETHHRLYRARIAFKEDL